MSARTWCELSDEKWNGKGGLNFSGFAHSEQGSNLGSRNCEKNIKNIYSSNGSPLLCQFMKLSRALCNVQTTEVGGSLLKYSTLPNLWHSF